MSQNIVQAKNSKVISLFPTNATTFTENQKCIFEMDESLGYIKGRDSYIVVDVENTSSLFDRWTFPQGVGAASLIKRLDIYSRSTGQLLESVENVNQWVGIENQYSRDDFSTEQMIQGVGYPSYAWTNTYDKATPADFITHEVRPAPGRIENNMISPLIEATAVNSYTARRFCIPIKSGLISRSWDSQEKLCPVLNLGGLRCEITWARNEEVCKILGMRSDNSTNANSNNILSLYQATAPGCRCRDLTAGDITGAVVETDEADVTGYFSEVGLLGLAVGNRVFVRGDDTTPAQQEKAMIIAGIATTATPGRIAITFTTNLNVAPDAFATAMSEVRVSLWKTVAATVGAVTKPSYKINNVEMRVTQMVVDKAGMAKLGKPMKYEFTSYNLFLNTLPTTILRHQVPIQSVASKAKSVFSCFVGSDEELDKGKCGYYSGLRPRELNLNSVQLFLNNRLYPLQSYNPRETQDKALTLNELVKSLATIAKSPLSLGSSEDGELEDYSNTFLYSRELGRGNFVVDMRNSEPEIRLGFSAVRTENVRINTYVFSKKIVDISPKGLFVEL